MRGRRARVGGVVLVGVGLALLAACGRAPEPTKAPAALVVRAPRSPRAIELERLVAERDHLIDAASTFSRRAQVPPPRPYTIPARGPFPLAKDVAEVVLYTYGHSRIAGTCEHPPFTKAGTLCADVVAPGTPLGEHERRLVEGLLETSRTVPSDETQRAKCFEDRHAIAFFDREGVVIANVLVSFVCGSWSISPSTTAAIAKPRAMQENQRVALAKLFDAHGLGAWAPGLVDRVPQFLREHRAPTPLEAEVDAYERLTYGTEAEPTPAGAERRGRRLMPGSGAPKDKALRDLSLAERQELCEWMTEDARPTRAPTSYGGARGYECDTDGSKWTSVGGDRACWTTPSSCTATVAEIESCLRVFHEPDDLCVTPPRACAGLRECLPSIARVR